MPRIKKYSQETVRAGLLSAFLKSGFSETSLVDLESDSGLNRRQLYNDFGSKKTVFIQALIDFTSIASQKFLAPLEKGNKGIESIRETLFGMIDIANTEQGRLGCLICNTSLEPIAKDVQVNVLIKQYFRRIENAYKKAIMRAMDLGEINKTENPVSLARYFLSIHVSLCVLSRGGESIACLRDIGNEAVKRLS